MSVLHELSGCDNPARLADVVFVHGLGGDPFETWNAGKDHTGLWPAWLGAEFPQVGIWSLGYAASPTKFARYVPFVHKRNTDAGYGMPLATRATQVLDRMVQKKLGDRPLVFISHSLGGLLVKQLLRSAYDEVDHRKNNIFLRTRAVLFLATPHAGATLASFITAFQLLFNATVTLQDLRAHDANLSNLYEWYRTKSGHIHTRSYYEQREIYGFTIVNSTSAHPGTGDTPVGLDEDHLSIAKPSRRDSQIYDAARDIVRELLKEQPPTYEVNNQPLASREEEEIVKITRIRDTNNKTWYGPIRPVASLDVWIQYSGKAQLFVDSARFYHLETRLFSGASGTFPPSHRYKIEYVSGDVVDKDLDPPLLINPTDQPEIHFELELAPTETVGGWSCCVVFLLTRTSRGAVARVPLLSPRPADLVLARVLKQAITVDLAALFEDGFYSSLKVPSELRRGRNFYRVAPDGSMFAVLEAGTSPLTAGETAIDAEKMRERINDFVAIALNPAEPNTTSVGAIQLLARYGDRKTVEPILCDLVEHSASAAKRNAARTELATLRGEDFVAYEVER